MSDLCVTAVRIALVRRVNSGRSPRRLRERDYALILLAGIVWCMLYGVGAGAMVCSGLPALMMLASFNVTGVVCNVSIGGAGIPRYSVAEILTCAGPFVLCSAMAPQPAMGLVALFSAILVLGLCAMLIENHRILVRKFQDERALIEEAHTDPLTGLPNRKALDRSLHDMLRAEIGRASEPLVVMCLDLDGFKTVNDTHGHPVGDRLLQAIAKRLRETVRNGDEVFRVGGDEFVYILPETGAEHAKIVAERIISALSQPVEIGPQECVQVGVSIGAAAYTASDTITDILKLADRALYEAKRSGKGRYRIHHRSETERPTEPPVGAPAGDLACTRGAERSLCHA